MFFWRGGGGGIGEGEARRRAGAAARRLAGRRHDGTQVDGGRLRPLSDISLHVATEKGEYGPVEDMHMIFDHLIGSYLIAGVRRERTAD